MSFLIYLGICFIFISPYVSCDFKDFYPEKHILLSKLDASPASASDYVLPKSLKPFGYNLTFLPYLKNSTFKGWTNIQFDVVNNTDRIVIHADPTTILNNTIAASVKSFSQTVKVINITTNSTNQFLTLKLSDVLQIQKNVTVSLSYDGILGTDMYGFYISTYNTTNASHAMAITQFESTFARRAFPCFDEPAYRANFTINIYRSANQNSLSNMPLESSVNSTNGLILDKYKTTPSMPTYLVAFGVSDLVNKSDGNTFRVFAQSSIIQDTGYLVQVGQTILDKTGNFVGVPYSLPKMDVVGVPDFKAGAMENWGLTTYREKYVQYNPVKNTWRDKFGVLSVVAHEFAHQWFGDLVTPLWWDYTWLNEAFATYFEYVTSNQIEPSWGMGSNMFIIEAVQYALSADTGSPRPMTSPVYSPDEIDDIFDYVIYDKGGSILRMMENSLTTPVWRAGLKNYLTNNSYGTGTPQKLFSALQDAANQAGMNINFTKTLEGWTTQAGYPLVTVTLVNESSSVSVYNVTQTPYSLNSKFSNQSWNIPLTYTTQAQKEFDASKAYRQWLLPASPNSSVVSVNGSGWIVINVGQIGFYRVNYDQKNWGRLCEQLSSNFSAVGDTNRGQLLDDAFHLARTGDLNYNTVFKLTNYLQHETALLPWNSFFANMKYLLSVFSGTATGDGLKKYAQKTLATPFRSLAANLNQSVSTFMGSMTVMLASQFACDIGLHECESLASDIFQKWRNNTSSYWILPEVKVAVMCTGLRLDTSKSAFMDVLDYYLNSNNAGEKLTVMAAMGCVTNEDAINTYLNVVCDDYSNRIRRQDRWIAFRYLLWRQTGVSAGLNYITNNFAAVRNAMGSDISRVMAAIAHTVNQQAHIDQIQSIVNNATVDKQLRDMLNSTVLPAVAKRQLWVKSQQANDLKTWVSSYVSSSGVASSAVVNILLILAAIVSFRLR